MVSSVNRYKEKTYVYYTCVACNTTRCRRFRRTENGKFSVRKAVLKYEKLHPERRVAWDIASSIKLSPCEVCGKDGTHRHHPDVYKPLEVVFLCPKHHKEAHAV